MRLQLPEIFPAIFVERSPGVVFCPAVTDKKLFAQAFGSFADDPAGLFVQIRNAAPNELLRLDELRAEVRRITTSSGMPLLTETPPSLRRRGRETLLD